MARNMTHLSVQDACDAVSKRVTQALLKVQQASTSFSASISEARHGCGMHPMIDAHFTTIGHL